MKKVILIVIALVIGSFVGCYRQRPEPKHAVFEEYLLCMFSDAFGYTLVGAKPASVDDSWTYQLKEFFPAEVEQADAFLSKVFAQSEKFIFRKISDSFWLINKKEMSKQILKHRNFHSFVCKKFGSTKEFFYQIQNGKSTLFKLLEFRAELVAIALGYGQDNGKFFLRRLLLGEYLQKYPIVQAYPFDGAPSPDKVRGFGFLFHRYLNRIKKPPLLANFPSLDSEWEWIQHNEWMLYKDSRPNPPFYLCLPAYVSCKSTEAKKVHKKFVLARDKLANLFCSQKPSEVILGLSLGHLSARSK